MSYYLVLVSPRDSPLYEKHLTSSGAFLPADSSSSVIISLPPTTPSLSLAGTSPVAYPPKGDPHLSQLVAHAALDLLDDLASTNKLMFLPNIESFHAWTVSAFITPGGLKMVLVHELKNEQGIRAFLLETWESYVKVRDNGSWQRS